MRALLAISLLLTGCVPIPRPTNIATAKGIDRKRPQLEFLKAGVTTRAEVAAEIGEFDTNASGGQFLWARWRQASVKVDWIPSGKDTLWSTHHLLAAFDFQDRLITYRICGNRELPGELLQMLKTAEYEPTGVDAPIRIPHAWHWAVTEWGKSYPGLMIIDNGSFSFVAERFARDGGDHSFTVPLRRIQEISVGDSPLYWGVSLRFQLEHGAGPFDKMEAEVSPLEVAQVFRVMERAGALRVR